MPAEFHDVPSPVLNAINVTGGFGWRSTVLDPDLSTRWTRSSSPDGACACCAVCSIVETTGDGENVVRYVVVVEPFSPGTTTSHVIAVVGPLTGSVPRSVWVTF